MSVSPARFTRAPVNEGGEAGGRPRVLYLTHRTPFPPNRGDRIRSHHTLRHLSRDADVWLGCVDREPPSTETRRFLAESTEDYFVGRQTTVGQYARGVLSLACGRSATEGHFGSPSLRRWIEGVTRDVRFDTVLIYCSGMWPYVRPSVGSGACVVVDLVDIDSEKWRSLAKSGRLPMRAVYAREAERVGVLEREIARTADHIALVSADETSDFAGIYGRRKAVAVPNGVDCEYFTPSPAEPSEPIVAFIGVLDYEPNIDGLHWFAESVWPALKRNRRDAEFRIVGRRPTRGVRRLCRRHGWRLFADVPDVRPHLHAAAVAVAPLRVARGVQNKVLEAMACGRPVVVSPTALRGIDAVPGRDLVRCDAAVEWTDHLTRLLSDPVARRRMGESARAFVERRHAWATCLSPLTALCAAGVEPKVRVPIVADVG